MKNQKSFTYFLILIIILIAGLTVWWWYSQNRLPTSPSSEMYYVGNRDQCPLIEYVCPEGYQGFNDNKGCGCELVPLKTADSNNSNWKTHTQNSSLFKIRLPSEFIVEEELLVNDAPSLNPSMIISYNPDRTLYLYIKSWEQFSEIVWGNDYSIKNYAYDRKKMLENLGPYIPSINTITLNNQESYKVSNYFDRDGYHNIFLYTSSANRNYEINCRIKPGSNELELTNLCEQILSTFEFVE